MATDSWADASDNWDTPGDWSAGLPTETSAVAVTEGDPDVTAPISIASLAISAKVTFADAGASDVSGGVTNAGDLLIDTGVGQGGSSLTIGGMLTYSGLIQIGASGNTLSANTTVTAAGLTNASSGDLIEIYGGAGSGRQAAMKIAGAAGFGTIGELDGLVYVTGNGLLQFGGGQITTIAANGLLNLTGPDAFVADAGATTSNSALTGLTTVAGNFGLFDGASLTTTGPLTVSGVGGASVSVGGRLTVGGAITIESNCIVDISAVMEAASLTNAGQINFYGGELEITGAAGLDGAGMLGGAVFLEPNSLVQFGSGQISSILFGGELTLTGPKAFVADAGATTSNSALAGLATIDGLLVLNDGASITTSGALVVDDGYIYIDTPGDGGSSLTVGGVLYNAGGVIRAGGGGQSEADNLTASGLFNTGEIDFAVSLLANDDLVINGAANNSGTIDLGAGGATISGPLTGNGTIDLSDGGVLSLGASASGGTISFGPGGVVDMVDGANIASIENFAAGDSIDLDSFSASYEAEFSATSTGGLLQIIDTANDDAVVASASFLGSLAGHAFALTQDGADTEITLTSEPWANPAPGDVVFTNVPNEPYSAYQYEYSAGGSFVGSEFFYTNLSGAYATEDVDYDGAGRLTRTAFSDLTNGAPYSSYEYDYVGGIFAGSKFEYTAVPGGATYSSYETDYNQANAFVGDKFFFTDITGQSYTGEEEDFDANSKLSRVLISGVTGLGYSSLEEDYSAGTYTGYKTYYTGISGQSYTSEEVDVSSANQLEKVVYDGMSSTPYSSVEQDYSGGAPTDTIYDFTKVTEASYYSYQVEENAQGALMETTYDLNNGGHDIVGAQNGLTLTSLGDDGMTGGGSGETFVFNPVFGADKITDFAANDSGAGHDTISLSTTDFANFTVVLSDAAASGAGGANTTIVSTATHDALTLNGVTTAQLAGLSGDFAFHS